MNGTPSLLSNDLQRGFNAGLSSLVPPRRMAVGGENEVDKEAFGYDDGAYIYEYDPETMTYKLVEKKKAVEEKTVVDTGDSTSSFTPPEGKPSGKGVVEDLKGFGKDVMDFVSKGGITGLVARGIMGALSKGDKGLSGLAGLFGGQGAPGAGSLTSEQALSLGGYGAGIDPEAGDSGGTPSVGPSVGVGGLGDIGGLSGSDTTSVLAHGGVAHAAKGMSMEDNSFIIPADVTAAMGNGSSQAGLRALQQHISPNIQMIRGNGDGMSDSIPANIAGTQPALISDGEAYVPPGVVQAMGGGNMSKGASNLYAMMDEARSQAHGKKKQQRQVNPQKIIRKVART